MIKLLLVGIISRYRYRYVVKTKKKGQKEIMNSKFYIPKFTINGIEFLLYSFSDDGTKSIQSAIEQMFKIAFY